MALLYQPALPSSTNRRRRLTINKQCCFKNANTWTQFTYCFNWDSYNNTKCFAFFFIILHSIQNNASYTSIQSKYNSCIYRTITCSSCSIAQSYIYFVIILKNNDIKNFMFLLMLLAWFYSLSSILYLIYHTVTLLINTYII